MINQAPPIPPITFHTFSNATNHLLFSLFEDKQNYTFWIRAVNGAYTSPNSALTYLVFDGDADIDNIKNLQVVKTTDNTIDLTWNKVKGADGYQISVTRLMHTNDVIKVNDTKVTLKNLSPGIKYLIKISAYKKTYMGQAVSISAVTNGTAIPSVGRVEALLVKPTSVKVSWDKPVDQRNANWEYGIYYGLNAAELFTSKFDQPIGQCNVLFQYRL